MSRNGLFADVLHAPAHYRAGSFSVGRGRWLGALVTAAIMVAMFAAAVNSSRAASVPDRAVGSMPATVMDYSPKYE